MQQNYRYYYKTLKGILIDLSLCIANMGTNERNMLLNKVKSIYCLYICQPIHRTGIILVIHRKPKLKLNLDGWLPNAILAISSL